jgi:N-sulfoglucosamine sulfohydrolase
LFMQHIESVTNKLTRRKFLNYSIAAAATAALGELLLSSEGHSATRPNIVLITADDLGQTLGCYGDKVARTPNIDRLASEGIQFLNSYVTKASCSSSRSSLFTGLYPHQTGGLLNEPVGQIGLAYTNSGYSMASRVVTLPQLLKAAGYRTGIIGKLHVAPETSFPFDLNLPPTKINTRNVQLVAQRAGEFFAQQSQQPFFLVVSYSDPHTPFVTQVNNYPEQPYSATEVPPFPWQGIDTPAMRERTAGYYNGVARLDAGIGLLLNQLTQQGLDQNTLVIFLGDHGPGFARAKGSCYEAGLRIPLTMRWSGRISPNLVEAAFVSNIDIFPTVLQAAGLKTPQVSGRSLFPLFQQNLAGWRNFVFAEYTSHVRTHFYPRRSIRGKRFKYILNLLPDRQNPYITVDQDPAFAESRKLPVRNQARLAMDTCLKPPAEELYDLHNDPYEFNNLAGKLSYQTTQNFLRSELLKWRQQTADPLVDPEVLAAMVKAHYG